MRTMEKRTTADGRQFYPKRRRTLISCTECHRRKQKCDRRQPCQNCVKRCKLDLCQYERTDEKTCNRIAPIASSGENNINSSTPREDSLATFKAKHLSTDDHRHLVTRLGYSTHNLHSTFSLVNKVGSPSSTVANPHGPVDVSSWKHTVLEDKYRALIRRLPSKEYINILVQQFFSEINWQYDVLDEITFHRQLEAWRCLPYSAHSREISSLPAELLAFPSLIIQLIAHSLIHRPIEEATSPDLESLKYAPGMTFFNLASEFSEAGYSLIESIEKKDISVVTIQSGILRASFLKNTGSVTEAWHVVGTTIRNAQEIGLHASGLILGPSEGIELRWDHEMRRRLWFVLHNWDIHMAVVLGRPITMIMVAEAVNIPDDCAKRESGQQPRTRRGHDAPTPFSVIRVGYEVAYQYFPQVRELEDRGARTEDYHLVKETHAAIVENMTQIPRWCHHDDPDVHFDRVPSCRWLPSARQSLTSGIYFVLLSLHRPYIFSVSESRMEALKAALMIFTCQKRLFHLSEPQKYLSFNMVYPMFDAMVISLAIYILFPSENRDVYSRSIENVYWGIDMLARVGQHNAMARSANDVAKTLLSRLEEGPRSSLQHPNHNNEEDAIERLGSETVNSRALETSLISGSTTDNVETSDLAELSFDFHHQELPMASNSPDFDADTLLPPRPVGDLFYQDVYATVPENLRGTEISAEFLQFEGTYNDDSFWSLMNDFDHV